MSGKLAAFLVMSTIWGLTWIAIKVGVAAVPPLAFASLRLMAAGVLLLFLASRREASFDLTSAWRRVVVAAVLVNSVSYGFLFWGMQFVPSGLSSVVNLSLIPVGLFTIGLAASEETYQPRKAIGIAVGVLGLSVLFLPKLTPSENGGSLAGMAALVVGTLTYCWGSILSRPLLRRFDPIPLSGWLTLVGGVVLLPPALLFEQVGLHTLDAFADLRVLAAWLFLVLGGSVVAFTLYLRLLRDWGPTRAGLYAFVSPIIAVFLGVIAFDEPFGRFEVAGSVLMLTAAALAMKRAPR